MSSFEVASEVEVGAESQPPTPPAARASKWPKQRRVVERDPTLDGLPVHPNGPYLVYEDDIPALDAAAARRASSPGTPTLTVEQRAEMRALRDEAVRRELERARARAE
jgi:hypothetical protein